MAPNRSRSNQLGKEHISKLLDAIKSEIANQNGLEQRLYVHQDNISAMKVYEKTALHFQTIK